MPTTRLTAAERRDLILDAADEVFGRLGFGATRMDDVAEAAGVAKGLLYKHFPSKDALFEALVEREGARFAETLRTSLDAVDPSGGPVAALQAGLSAWLDVVSEGPPGFYFSDPGSHPAYASIHQQALDVITRIILAFEPDTPPAVARLVAAAVQGAAENVGLAWMADSAGTTREEALGILSAFCWGGLSLMRGEQ